MLKGCAFPFNPPAPISEGDTFNVLPFDNVTVRVDGISPTKLKQLLEHGYGSLPGYSGRFPQTSDMNVTVKPPRRRVPRCRACSCATRTAATAPR